MSSLVRVALSGFSGFERKTFESFFRLAANRSPAYTLADKALGADFVLCDDSTASEDSVRRAGALSRCIVIGTRQIEGSLGLLPRPINMMSLLRFMDARVRDKAAGATSAPTQAPTPARAAAPAPARAPAPEPETRAALDDILVVDDSDIALRFMADRLNRFGFQVHLCRSGEEALRRVTERHFEFVFMDVTMEGIDGYTTCRHIKKQTYPAGRRPPSVVMLTSRGGTVDRIRGTMAGCDAYLTKPLQEQELLKVIGDRIVSDAAQSDTVAHAMTR